MRVNAALLSVLYSSATLLGAVRADDDVTDPSSSSVAESSTSSPVEKPTFTVCLIAPMPNLINACNEC